MKEVVKEIKKHKRIKKILSYIKTIHPDTELLNKELDKMYMSSKRLGKAVRKHKLPVGFSVPKESFGKLSKALILNQCNRDRTVEILSTLKYFYSDINTYREDVESIIMLEFDKDFKPLKVDAKKALLRRSLSILHKKLNKIKKVKDKASDILDNIDKIYWTIKEIVVIGESIINMEMYKREPGSKIEGKAREV